MTLNTVPNALGMISEAMRLPSFRPVRITFARHVGGFDQSRCHHDRQIDREQQGVAIWAGFGNDVCTDGSGGTNSVVHQHRLTPTFSEFLGIYPRHHIRWPCCGKRHHQANRFGGKALGPCTRAKQAHGPVKDPAANRHKNSEWWKTIRPSYIAADAKGPSVLALEGHVLWQCWHSCGCKCGLIHTGLFESGHS